jgi:hypothetical protein
LDNFNSNRAIGQLRFQLDLAQVQNFLLVHQVAFERPLFRKCLKFRTFPLDSCMADAIVPRVVSARPLGQAALSTPVIGLASPISLIAVFAQSARSAAFAAPPLRLLAAFTQRSAS